LAGTFIYSLRYVYQYSVFSYLGNFTPRYSEFRGACKKLSAVFSGDKNCGYSSVAGVHLIVAYVSKPFAVANAYHDFARKRICCAGHNPPPFEFVYNHMHLFEGIFVFAQGLLGGLVRETIIYHTQRLP